MVIFPEGAFCVGDLKKIDVRACVSVCLRVSFVTLDARNQQISGKNLLICGKVIEGFWILLNVMIRHPSTCDDFRHSVHKK